MGTGRRSSGSGSEGSCPVEQEDSAITRVRIMIPRIIRVIIAAFIHRLHAIRVASAAEVTEYVVDRLLLGLLRGAVAHEAPEAHFGSPAEPILPKVRPMAANDIGVSVQRSEQTILIRYLHGMAAPSTVSGHRVIVNHHRGGSFGFRRCPLPDQMIE